MGALGYTTFCRNGHIVESIPYHCISYNTVCKCPYCGETKFTTETGWQDSDYGPHKVPYKSIRTEWVERNDAHFKGRQNVAVYDVSRVKIWSEPTQDIELVCVDCGEKFILEGGEIDFYNRKGLSLPKRCKGCRAVRKITL